MKGGGGLNIQHLKYVLEVASTGSINKAAENLYMGQPNLSRAIRELEEKLGITIFDRTPKGICVTEQGKEFLLYAKKILQQIDQVEKLYKSGGEKEHFSISAPRAAYIFLAFSRFLQAVSSNDTIKAYYREADNRHTVNSLLHSDCDLGIIRYNADSEKTVFNFLEEKGIRHQPLSQFRYVVVMNKQHPLANKKHIIPSELKEYTEIICADLDESSAMLPDFDQGEDIYNSRKCICVSDREMQTELLERVKGAYAYVTPMPKEVLKKYGLVEKESTGRDGEYKDILVYRSNYKLSPLDCEFLEYLEEAKEESGL